MISPMNAEFAAQFDTPIRLFDNRSTFRTLCERVVSVFIQICRQPADAKPRVSDDKTSFDSNTTPNMRRKWREIAHRCSTTSPWRTLGRRLDLEALCSGRCPDSACQQHSGSR